MAQPLSLSECRSDPAPTWTLDIEPEPGHCCWPFRRSRVLILDGGVACPFSEFVGSPEDAVTKTLTVLSDKLMKAVGQELQLSNRALSLSGVDLMQMAYGPIAPTWGQVLRIQEAVRRLQMESLLPKIPYQKKELVY